MQIISDLILLVSFLLLFSKKDEVDGAPIEKKIKKEENEENQIDDIELKKQNDKMFKYRDSLTQLTRTQLTELLRHNDQEDPVGVDRVSYNCSFKLLQVCKIQFY